MRKSKAVLVAAVAGLALSSVGQAASIVTSLSLFKPDGTTPIPQVGGVYQLTGGDHFKVQFNISIPDPNITRANRSAAQQPNKPLGLQTINGQIISSANDVLNPVGDGTNSPQHWVNDPNGDFTDITPDNLGFAFQTLTAIGDPDLDVNGVGMVNTNFAIASASGIAGKQYGAAGGPQAGPFGIQMGDYIAKNLGATPLLSDLHVLINSTGVYVDGASGTGVSSQAATSVTDQPIQVSVAPAPEPASIALLGLAGLGALRRRRSN